GHAWGGDPAGGAARSETGLIAIRGLPFLSLHPVVRLVMGLQDRNNNRVASPSCKVKRAPRHSHRPGAGGEGSAAWLENRQLQFDGLA
ncbi:MAG: hypothetical protein ACK6BM_08080, partial [Cyanobacteriota bacterium]